ncbi:MAG: glutamate--tRNA ligase [Ruminococcaceae bacterium]|nr:glutamate--tRNA ligase [Oscillospiraceae bacterium]
MDYQKLAELLFPNLELTPEDIEKRYPARNLPEGAKVTRVAPSPTGFMHLGNLFSALVGERLAHQSNGVFFLRIEDTDLKRAVEGGVETIIKVFNRFGLNFDEGAGVDDQDVGAYGPYRQRQRAEIYHVYARELVLKGMAYPCFCTEEELTAMRETQQEQKLNFGYYGQWAKCRDLTLEEIEENIKAGKPYVLRFRSPGKPENRIKHKDLVKGDMEMPENDQDIVILKSDGIPTYHFAHVIDDHFMGTTHVVRGEEWLATLNIHLQLFYVLGWKAPKYVHTAQLMKMDGGSKRKLSKRKDPELALDFYHAEGYPVKSVLEYLMTLLNSNFEEWRLANPTADFHDFQFTTNKMSVSGSLFDIDKLLDVSKNTVSMMTAEEVYEYVLDWAMQNDNELYGLFAANPEKAKSILAIGRGGAKPRKDIAIWKEVKDYVAFFYPELYIPAEASAYPENVSKEDCKAILEGYLANYDVADDNSQWFDKVRSMGESLGYAGKPKDYKKNPDQFKGHVGDVSAVIRLAVTGRTNSPDLCAVMQVLGQEEMERRVREAIEILK